MRYSREIFFILFSLFLVTSYSNSQVYFEVQTPVEIQGYQPSSLSYASPGADWGVPDLTDPLNAITEELVVVDDDSPGDTLGCDPLVNGGSINGKIALVFRGICEYGTKALNAQNAGAIGVVIVNNIPNAPAANMAGGVDGPSVNIPVVMINYEAWQDMSSYLASGVEVFIGSFPKVDNDMSVLDARNTVTGASGAAITYYKTPITQVQPWTIQGTAANIGNLDQTQVTLDADINSGQFITSSAPMTFQPEDTVDLTGNNTFTPASNLGTYTVDYSVNASENDENLINNSETSVYEVTNSLYSRDNGVVAGGVTYTGFPGGYSIGNIYDIFNDVYLDSVEFVVDPASVAGNDIIIYIYEYDSGTTNFTYINEGYHELTTDDVSGYNAVSVPPFLSSLGGDEGYSTTLLEAGKSYLIAIQTYNPNDFYIAYSEDTPPQSSVFVQGDDGQFYTSKYSPMIRMHISEVTCIQGDAPSVYVESYTPASSCGSPDGSVTINANSFNFNDTSYVIGWTGPSSGTIISNNYAFDPITGLAPGNYDAYITGNHPTIPACDTNFFSFEIPSPTETQDICVITVDEFTSTHNVIAWEKPSDIGYIDSFFVYREITLNNYDKIGAVHRDSLSLYNDFDANPNATNYKYKLSVLDTCGVETDLSIYHNSIHLLYFGSGTFSWTSYEVENSANPISSYNFYRDDTGQGPFNIIQIIPGGNTTFQDPDFDSFPNARYRVDVNWDDPKSCEPTKANINTSRSNVKTQTIGVEDPDDPNVGIVKNELHNWVLISPNPSFDNTTLKVSSNLIGKPYTITSSIGKVVMSGQIKTEESDLNLQSLSSGFYYISIPFGDFMITKKVIKR